MEIKIDTKLQGIFLKDPKRAAEIFVDEWRNFLEEASAYTMRRIIIGTPVFQGTLSGSMFREIRGNGVDMFAINATNQIYGNVIETGQPAFFPNPIGLADWVRLKLGIKDQRQISQVTFLIARAISKRGLKKAHWMFRNAFTLLSSRAQGMVNKMGSKIIAKWNQS